MSIKKLFPQSIKNIYHLFQAILANLIYGFPSRNIKIIGVTGTNGKTTTVQMIAKILEESGAKVAMASTINFKLGEKEWVNATKFTTLSSFKIQKFIKNAVKTGCEYLVLETSSHSLDQFRTWGIRYDTAVITNVTREHLDYHKNIQSYRNAKKILFKQTAESSKAKVISNLKIAVRKSIIVNLDMEKPEEFLDFKVDDKFGYSTNEKSKLQFTNYNLQKVIAKNIELGINSSSYMIHDTSYRLYLPGLFNVENALAATCVGLAYNISLENIKNALEKIQGVPGRMEHIPNNRGVEIIVDYALTPDSLEKLYELISKIKKEGSKIISVFGACGERDRGKRPIMGEIVSRYADYIILTNEDPYGENPIQIIDEVFSGIIKSPHPDFASAQSTLSRPRERGLGGEGNKFAEGVNCWRILDRRAAIKKALQIAKPGDIFVITGKGAEEVMAIGKERIPWNEKKVILEELKSLNKF